MLNQIQGLHIEPTNMCTLKCPDCGRTEFLKMFPKKWTNKNLNLNHLKEFLDIDLKGLTINICGTYGDAIYYDQLFDMVKFFKDNGSKISLATNGSYKSKEWWQNLASLLDNNDEVILAIDGLPDTFTTYRINADWSSIETAINVLKQSPTQLVWQYILFLFNEHQVNEAQELSKKLGFDKFFVRHSERWDSDRTNVPSTVNQLTEKRIEWNPKSTVEIDPLCKRTHSEHYISADGYYMPCCFVHDYRFYYKSSFFKNKNNFDISKTTLSAVLTQSKDFYNTLEDAKIHYCTFNCPGL